MLADEVLTPDSSRFWPADEWQPGRAQPSYDKQIVRDWLLSPASGWDRASGEPPPPLPDEVVEHTRARYLEAFETLTGLSLVSRDHFTVTIELPHPPATLFRFLAEPRNRPLWQASLRTVADVDEGEPDDGHAVARRHQGRHQAVDGDHRARRRTASSARPAPGAASTACSPCASSRPSKAPGSPPRDG